MDRGDAAELDAALAAASAAGASGAVGLAVGALCVMTVAACGLLAWRRGVGSVGRSRREVGGVRLLIRFGLAFALVVAAAWAFAELAEALRDGPEVLGQLDDAYASALRASLHPGVHASYAWATRLADPAVLTVLSGLLVAGLWWRGRRRLALACALAMAGQGLLTLALKGVFERIRPLHAGEPLASGWSFPSGHTVGATVYWGMVAYCALRTLPRYLHLPIVLVAAALAWSIGVSRVVIGVHHPSDVLAGFAVGASWLVAVTMVVEGLRWRAPRDVPPR